MPDIIEEATKLLPRLEPYEATEVEVLLGQLKEAIQYNHNTIERRSTAQLRAILKKHGVGVPKTRTIDDDFWD